MATLGDLMVRVGADISEFQRNMRQVGKGMSEVGSSMRGITDKVNPLLTTIGGLAPAILSMGGALTSASIGFAGFGAVAVGVLGDVFEASTDLAEIDEKLLTAKDGDEVKKLMEERKAVISGLSETQQQAVKDLDNFKSKWGEFTKAFEKPIGQAFGTGLNIVMKALDLFKPAIMGITNYVNELMTSLNKKMDSESFQTFVDFVTAQAVPTFDKLMQVTGNLIGTVANLFRAFSQDGQGTLDFLVNFTQKIEDMTDKFASLPQGVRSAVLVIGALGALFVPLVVVLGMVAQGIGALTAVFGAVSLPVLAVVAGIALLVAGFVLAYKKIEPFRELVNKIFDKVKEKVTQAVGAVVTFVKQKLDQMKQFWDENGKQILEALHNVWDFVAPIIETGLKVAEGIVKFIWDSIKGIIDGALKVIMGLVKIFSGLFTGDFSKMWEGVKDVFFGAIQVVWNYMNLSFVGAIKGLILKFVKAIGKFFVGMWDDIVLRFLMGKDKVLNYVNGLKTSATNLFSKMKDSLINFAKNIWDNVVRNFNNMKTSLTNVGNNIKSTVTNAFNNMKNSLIDLAKKIWNNVVNNFNNMKNSITNVFSNIKTTVLNAWNNVKQYFSDAISNIGTKINNFKSDIATKFTNIKDSIVGKIKDTVKDMKSKFKEGLEDVVSDAKGLPKKIGDAISGAAGKVKDGVKALGNKVIDVFKETLGIHSPSKVFEKLGGYVMAGLKNGISKDNIKTFASKQFGKLTDGALESWSDIKSFFSGNTLSSIKSFFSSAGGNLKDFFTGAVATAGTGVNKWRGVATQALMMTGQFSQANLERMLYQMQTESGGNPRAINLWDSNAKKGTPSKGLMQVIDPTFASYKMPGFNNIWNPLDNMLASIRYAVSRYGSLTRAYRGVGYAKGGVFKGTQVGSLVHMAENGGDEAIVPLSRKRYMAPFASAIAEHLDTSGGGQTVYQNNITLNATIREDADVDKIAKAIVREQTKQNRAGGKKK
jgi:SLT domain-containing protein/phage-related protein